MFLTILDLFASVLLLSAAGPPSLRHQSAVLYLRQAFSFSVIRHLFFAFSLLHSPQWFQCCASLDFSFSMIRQLVWALPHWQSSLEHEGPHAPKSLGFTKQSNDSKAIALLKGKLTS
jgi:hypothetical protein